MDRVRMERRCTSYQRVVIWIQGYTITWWDIWYNWITFQLLNGTDYKKYIWYVQPIWWILLGTLNVELQPQNFCSFRQSTDTATCQLTTFAYIKHQMYVNSSLILIIHFVAAYLACQIMEYQKGGGGGGGGGGAHGRQPLQWRHNGRDCVSNDQPPHCLLNRLFRRRSKKTSKLRVTNVCAVNSRHKWSVTRKRFQLDDVIMSENGTSIYFCHEISRRHGKLCNCLTKLPWAWHLPPIAM